MSSPPVDSSVSMEISSSAPPPSSLDSLAQPQMNNPAPPPQIPSASPTEESRAIFSPSDSSTRLPVDSNGRVVGSIEKPFVYGSSAFWLGKQAAENQHSHRWSVFLRGLENEDLSYFIKSVTFGLHESFTEANRTISTPPFEVHETGWGEFSVSIKVQFHDESIPMVVLQHQLKLFPPPGTQATTKKPVMSEVYDEFVFHNPAETFYQQLLSGPRRRFDTHQLNPFWTTKEFAREETSQLIKLTAAQTNVKSRLERERQKLFLLEQEINQLTSKIH